MTVFSGKILKHFFFFFNHLEPAVRMWVDVLVGRNPWHFSILPHLLALDKLPIATNSTLDRMGALIIASVRRERIVSTGNK